jgi:predicted nucleic acid-binding protein
MIISIDTNVFIYAADSRDMNKQAAAIRIVSDLAARRAPVALQVIGEIHAALHRRLRMPVHFAAQHARNILVAFETFSFDERAVDNALAQAGAGRMSYWDALLVFACAAAKVDALLTEDMQDGARLGGVEIVNPFGESGLSVRAQSLLGI